MWSEKKDKESFMLVPNRCCLIELIFIEEQFKVYMTPCILGSSTSSSPKITGNLLGSAKEEQNLKGAFFRGIVGNNPQLEVSQET